VNTRFFTGYLPADALEAWAPATADRPAQPRLIFEVMIADSHGVTFPEKCLVDDANLVREWQPLLTAGRAVVIQGEQTARPWHDKGVLKGYAREVRVQRMEFPSRGGKKEAPEQPAEAAA